MGTWQHLPIPGFAVVLRRMRATQLGKQAGEEPLGLTERKVSAEPYPNFALISLVWGKWRGIASLFRETLCIVGG